MNIDFELYRIFYVVANNSNITRASKELNISQPAISKSIKNLEEQLSMKLLERKSKGVEYINNAENKFTDLINLEVGCIKIGVSTTLTKEFLLPYLEQFHSLYPKIDIQIITNLTSELVTKLKNGLIDILILNIDDKNYGNDVNIIKCKKINDCFVVNNKYQNLVDKKLSLKDLNNYPLILQAKGSNTRKFLDNIAEENGVILKPNIELASYSLVVEFAKIGFGIAYVTKEYVEDEIKNGSLFELKIKEKIPSRDIGIALSKNHVPNFSTKKLMEIITK